MMLLVWLWVKSKLKSSQESETIPRNRIRNRFTFWNNKRINKRYFQESSTFPFSSSKLSASCVITLQPLPTESWFRQADVRFTRRVWISILITFWLLKSSSQVVFGIQARSPSLEFTFIKTTYDISLDFR